MKNALIITSYKDFSQLKKMVDIYSKYFDCYIHIDKKSKNCDDFIQYANKKDNVFVVKKYKINWGSYKHISAFLYLLKIAVKTNKYDFFHLISENTFMCKSYSEFEDYFENHLLNNFIEVEPVKADYIINRYKYYHFLHLYNLGKVSGRKIDSAIRKIQIKLNIFPDRSYKYKGYIYCHINRDFANYVLKYLKSNNSYLKQLKSCNVPEEFFFQNIIMNSPFKDTLINDPLIFDRWIGESPNPEVLSEGDYDDIINSNAFFARKFSSSSDALFNKLICNKNL